MNIRPDPGLEALLFLDGESFVADTAGRLWVKFDVRRVEASASRPHGLKYSLTLHNEEGERVLGFDNAHPVREGSGPGVRTRVEYDHKHQGKRIRFYDYEDAATLLSDFWREVEQILQERSL
ncbi:DUF6516 family protein [Castellaniella ginsengisoli]|uniref:DUF6516 family protein n=1 Tax=Castellaniella ginsengisoli TaxID=546114 RepID=A0AB39EN94_9BURK